MKSLFYFIALALISLALLASCRAKKAVQTDVSLATDSLAVNVSHRTSLSIDSLMSRLSLSFDTLTITVERPCGVATEIVRLEAARGQIVSSRNERKLAVESSASIDSTASNTSSVDRSTEQTQSTQVYDPPDTTLVLSLACIALLISCIIWIYIRNR